LPGTLKRCPTVEGSHSVLPGSRYSQAPATHSMVSGAAVPNTRLDASTTPTDFLLPSAMVSAWLTHLPSK
jgi:hypothetical protein